MRKVVSWEINSSKELEVLYIYLFQFIYSILTLSYVNVNFEYISQEDLIG